MERLRSKGRLRTLKVAMTLGSLSVATGCGAGSHEITAAKPVTILSEKETSRYVTAQEAGGYQHYEEEYWMTVEQCGRSDLEIANEDGCVVLQTQVDGATFEQFDTGDTIHFVADHRGYPVS